MSLLRWALTLGGAYLVTHMIISQEQLNEVIGYLMILTPGVWGYVEKFIDERRAKARETLAVQAGAIAAQQGSPVAAVPETITKDQAQDIIAEHAPP